MTSQDMLFGVSVACFAAGGAFFAIAARYYITRDIRGVRADLLGKSRWGGARERVLPSGDRRSSVTRRTGSAHFLRGQGSHAPTPKDVAPDSSGRPDDSVATSLQRAGSAPCKSDGTCGPTVEDSIPTEVMRDGDESQVCVRDAADMSGSQGFVVTRRIVCVHADADVREPMGDGA